MKKREAKAIAYDYYASMADEMVSNGDWEQYSQDDKELIIHCIDEICDELRLRAENLRKINTKTT